ncbi:hypothetical protein HYW75_03755 [Candidatus Pacearchaeota archaeon]|nr:hypothetical protein [Candidatus Pacearchaeota archaeon]
MFELLKRKKDEMRADSYGEVISRALLPRSKKKSMAGYLGKFLTKQEIEEILQDDRRREERF